MDPIPVVDKTRTVPAAPFDWRAAGHPGYGPPGYAGRHGADYLHFACPGCGRFGAIRCGRPKPDDSPSWGVVAGRLDDVTTLTLSPSINCVGCCGWHGYLTAGVFTSV